jgi:outer membrane protein
MWFTGRMIRTLLNVLLGWVLIAGMTGSAAAQGRIATVDLGKVFEGFWKTKQADAAWKDRAAELEKEHKTLADDWKKGKDEYQKLYAVANDQAVSAEEREKRKKSADAKLKEIKDLEDTIAQFERQARTTLDELRLRLRNNLLDAIRKAINSRAKSAGYALVIDTTAESAKNTPVVLYTNNDNDLSESVLQMLNTDAPPEPAKTTPKPADDKKPEKK